MSEHMICLMPTSSQSLFVHPIKKAKNCFLLKESFLRKIGGMKDGTKKKRKKKGFLTAVATVIKKDPQ